MIIQTLWGPEEVSDTKMCYSCREVKHLDLFANRGHRKDGSRETKNICKVCQQHQTKVLNKVRKEIPKPNSDHKCGICGDDEEYIRGRGAFQGLSSATAKTIWVLDHDHETETAREYICDYCNIMIGRSLDRPEVLEAGAAYLRRHRGDN